MTESTRDARALLNAAKRRIAHKRVWTRTSTARDSGGTGIDPTHPNAVSWCVNGALIRAEADLFGTITNPIYLDADSETWLQTEVKPAEPLRIAMKALYDAIDGTPANEDDDFAAWDESIMRENDSLTHKEVMAWLDRAIARTTTVTLDQPAQIK